MVSAALKIALLYIAIMYIDQGLLSWQTLTRPIVIAPLAGLVIGDFHTGIIMGAELEAIFMGISAIGGSIPADATMASLIAVAYTVLTGASIEEGISIAYPIGTVIASLSAFMTPVWAALAPMWEKMAAECNPKKFLVVNLVAGIFFLGAINGTLLFFSVAYGVAGLNAVLASLPAWFMTGLGAASGMMLAIGFAILTSMIWSGETGIFFFVGYVLVAYGVCSNTLAIAILGAAIAITMFMSEKRSIDLKNSLANTTVVNDEEDFF